MAQLEQSNKEKREAQEALQAYKMALDEQMRVQRQLNATNRKLLSPSHKTPKSATEDRILTLEHVTNQLSQSLRQKTVEVEKLTAKLAKLEAGAREGRQGKTSSPLRIHMRGEGPPSTRAEDRKSKDHAKKSSSSSTRFHILRAAKSASSAANAAASNLKSSKGKGGLLFHNK